MPDQPPFIFPNPYGPPGTPADARKLIHFLTDGVQPPSSVYLDVDDKLFIEIQSTDTNPVFVVTYKILNPHGEIISGQQTINYTVAARQTQTVTVPLTEGFLVSVTLNPSIAGGGTRFRGLSRGEISLSRGPSTGLFRYKVLTQGMVSAKSVLDWPPGIHELEGYGQGFMRSVTGTTPAAGAEISETIPSFTRWGLKTFRFQFTTSATVANRAVDLVIDDGVNQLYLIEAPSTQAASTVNGYNYANVGGRFDRNITNQITIPIPSLNMMQGWRIRTITQGLQAGDQYTAPQYHVEDWIMDG